MTFESRTVEQVEQSVMAQIVERRKRVARMISFRITDAVAYVLGDEHEIHGMFCPSCAVEREAFDSSIVYVEPMAIGEIGARRCDGCSRFPLAIRAIDLLRPTTMAFLMGRIYQVARRAAARLGGDR